MRNSREVMADNAPETSVRGHQPLGPIPQGSESLEVWSDLYKPIWTRLGTIVRRGGRHGKIVCTPEGTELPAASSSAARLRRDGLVNGVDQCGSRRLADR